MNDISKKIFKEYKSANVIGMAIQNKVLAALVRIVTLILFVLAIGLFIRYQEVYPIQSSIAMLLFMLASGFSYNLLVKYILKKQNIKRKNIKLSPQDIARMMLKEILITHGMYSTKGVEYLLAIYNRKAHIINIPWVALIGIIFSPIFSNIIDGLLSAGNRLSLLDLMVSTKETIPVKIIPVIAITTVLIILIAAFLYVYRNTKDLVQILFGFGYTTIIYDLEYILLPEIICTEGVTTSLNRAKCRKNRNRNMNEARHRLRPFSRGYRL